MFELEMLLIILFTSLVCIGVHAVTRPDKLLWFLGVRIHSLDKILEVQKLLGEKAEKLFDEKEKKQGGVYDKYQDAQSDVAQKELEEIEDWYEKELEELNSRFAMQIDWLEKRANLLAQKPFIAFILPFAPALTECPTCMASFWGSLVFILHFSGLLLCPFVAFPLCLMAVAGVNTILSR